MSNENTGWHKRRAVIIAVASIAFVAKLLLALKTYGTNDVYTYERFGLWSRYFGAELYRIAPDLNHPPSVLHFMSSILWISEHTRLPFHFWLRFPGILADAGSLWLVCRILRARLAERSVFVAVLFIAIAPIHIMISGFHGNTDPVMIFFVMLAVWLAGDCENAAAGGAAYGMALCIKIAPVILIPVLFLSLPGMRKRIAFFAAAAAVVVVTWSPYIFDDPSAVIHQVFGYKSSYGLWGFSWIFRQLANVSPAFGWINSEYSRFGSILVMGAILALSIVMSRLPKKPSLYTQVGMIYLLFFSITSGFGVQYLAWLTPWVAELGALPVGLFVVTGSVFLLVVYNYWTLGMPWYLAIAYPWSSHQYFQVLCWLSVVLLTLAAWSRIRHDREFGLLRYIEKLSPSLRWSAAGIGFAVLLFYPAFVHMRHDRLSVSPSYAEDEALYTEADATQNLATELARHGRRAEADAVQHHAEILTAQAQTITNELAKTQPLRYTLWTPENYVDASLDDYNGGDFTQCIHDATESLKTRPSMPAAWNNISLCNAELGNWDAALAAATEALRIEPESDVVRENLEWIAGEKRKQASGR